MSNLSIRPTVTAVILTKNEEQHLRRALDCIAPHCREIVIVDSGSDDGTEAIAREFGARFAFNPWKNYATQFNHGIALAGTESDWLLRLDADEILDPDWYARFAALVASRSVSSINSSLTAPAGVFPGPRTTEGTR